jgi:uncharacterized linocin/CFP29 family protein
MAQIATDIHSLPSGLASQLLAAEMEMAALLSANPGMADDDMGRRVATMRRAQHRQAEMRGLAPLWKDAQEQIDNSVVRVGREGLSILADRMEQASVNLPNWLGVMELTSHKLGESRKANIGMIPGSRPDGGGIQDKVPYTLPIPVIWDEFGFNARELAAARRVGRPLEMDEAEQAVRNVNFAAEDLIIHGLPVNIAGNTIPGLLDTTNTQAYESNMAWDNTSKTGADILTDVLALRTKAAAVKRYGPYTLYVNTEYSAALQKPFDSSSGARTIQQYLEALTFGNRTLRVRVADLLPANRVLLIQDSPDMVDVIVGQQPVAINPAPEIEFYTKWLVYAVIVPRIKSDINGNFGIVAGNTT